jgi:transposase-like protein
VHPHQRHLCSGCGQNFRDSERAIGNPLARIWEKFNGLHKTLLAPRRVDIDQVQFPNGIQIWGSNPSIVWTSGRSEEEGIHIHAFGDSPLDDTFSSVTIDGVPLDPTAVRTLMAQNALPHIAGRVAALQCPKCKESHFDTGEHAFTPHEQHICAKCKIEFRSRGRIRKVIGNPIVEVFRQLAGNAPRPARKHDIGLLSETI